MIISRFSILPPALAIGSMGIAGFLSTAENVAANTTCSASAEARFIESAPRDRFEISNKSRQGVQIASIDIDLKGSKGNLIFDTIEGGEGVEVFQPYRTANGKELLVLEPKVADGAEQIALVFKQFGPDKGFSFSIDVDDRLANSELGNIRVSGSEMQGAKMTIKFQQGAEMRSETITFDASNKAVLKGSCS